MSKLLKKKYGNDNVVMSDIVRASRDMTETGWYDYGFYDELVLELCCKIIALLQMGREWGR